MLYGNESISHYTRSNIAIWMTMAFQAGLLNIGGFMACHRFVSHVTGFATFFGYEVSQVRYSHAMGMLAVPLFFLFGSMLSGQLVDIRLKLHRKPKYYITFGVIFMLILSVFVGGVGGMFGEFGEIKESTHNYFLLAILCLVCGIQNGTVSTVSRSVVRTTHLTGITTDLGLGIVRFFHRERLGGHSRDEISANLMRMGIIIFFGLGSAAGGLIYYKLGYGGFILPVITSGILFFGSFYFQVFRHPEIHAHDKLTLRSREQTE